MNLGDDPDRAEDEYDSYLMQAAGRAWNGASDNEVADYLLSIEAGAMGYGNYPPASERALLVAQSIQRYVESLKAQPHG